MLCAAVFSCVVLDSVYCQSGVGWMLEACSGSYRDDPAGPTAGLAEPVPCEGMPAVSGAAGGRGFVRGRGAFGAWLPRRCLLSFILLCCKTTSTTRCLLGNSKGADMSATYSQQKNTALSNQVGFPDAEMVQLFQ